MKKNFFLVLIVAGLFCLTACGGKETMKEPTINLITVYDGDTVDLCEPEVRAYLNAETEEEQVKALIAKGRSNCDHQAMAFSWENDGSSKYTLYIADNKQFENSYTFETSNTMVQASVLIPGTTYYWKVVGSTEKGTEKSASEVDTFQTLDAPVRFITTAEIPNVRDIGGWDICRRRCYAGQCRQLYRLG